MASRRPGVAQAGSGGGQPQTETKCGDQLPGTKQENYPLALGCNKILLHLSIMCVHFVTQPRLLLSLASENQILNFKSQIITSIGSMITVLHWCHSFTLIEQTVNGSSPHPRKGYAKFEACPWPPQQSLALSSNHSHGKHNIDTTSYCTR